LFKIKEINVVELKKDSTKIFLLLY